MRAASIEPSRYGAVGLTVVGVVVLALSLAYLLAAGGGYRDDGAARPAAHAAKTSEIIAFWEDRVRLDPADFTAYNRLAQAYIQRARETGDVSDYSRAAAAVEASLQSVSQDNLTALALRASLQNVKHDFAGAAETALGVLALDSADTFALGVLGDAQAALGQYDAAETTFEKLVAVSPGLSSFSRLAYIHELRGDLREAETAWLNALSTDGGRRPENTAWAHVQFGDFYFNQGMLDEATTQYREALSAFPGFVHGEAALGRVAAARGDYEKAIALYEDVVARQPLPEYVAALGDVYRAAGREAEAQDRYDLVGAIAQLYEANGINTDLAMALFLADHNLRPVEAVRQARAVYERQASVQAADALAWALYKNGSYIEAAELSQEALRLGTRDASFFFHAGMIQRALGKDDLARASLRTAIEINRHFSVLNAPIARATLAELEGE